MTQLFTITYLVNRGLRQPADAESIALAFFSERAKTGPRAFPYDAADDPSFFCATHFESSVTWGVCRTDVRNQIKVGDWVAMFSAERVTANNAQDIDYRFIAIQCVSDMLDALNLPQQYNQYLNRLVERHGHRLRHVEPALSPRDWHPDWLWRVSSGPGQRKRQIELLGRAGEVDEGALHAARSVARNYVVFDRNTGLIMKRPPLVATKRAPDQGREQWLGTPEVQALRTTIFGAECERWLRTSNRHQPHRHTRRKLAGEAAWIKSVKVIAAGLT